MKHVFCFIATVLLSTAAFAQLVTAPPDAYQVRYLGNLLAGDASVNLTNTGVVNGNDPAGNICANIYVIDPSQEIMACCSCRLTPNALTTLSGKKNLTMNPLHSGALDAVTVALLASTPNGGICNAANVTQGNLVSGLRAWATSLHATPIAGAYAVTETEFSPSPLSVTQLTKLTLYCSLMRVYDPYGMCRCPTAF